MVSLVPVIGFKRMGATALMLVVMGAAPSLLNAQVQRLREGSRESERGSGKFGLLYRVSSGYLFGATVLDGVSTTRVLNHPTMAYRADGSALASYHGREVGWAKVFGERNTSAAVGANVALNAGLSVLSRNLYRRGGRWRVLAIGLNVLKGTDNLAAGIHNIRYNAGVDSQIRSATGYRDQISWSH